MEAPSMHKPHSIGVNIRMFTKVCSPADSFTVEEVCILPYLEIPTHVADHFTDPWPHGQGCQYPKYVGYCAW